MDFDAQSLLKEAEKELVKASQIKEGPIRMIDWLAKEKNKTIFFYDCSRKTGYSIVILYNMPFNEFRKFLIV